MAFLAFPPSLSLLLAYPIAPPYLSLPCDAADRFARRSLQEYHTKRLAAGFALEVEKEVLKDATPSLLHLLLLGVGFQQVPSLGAHRPCLVRQLLQVLLVELRRLSDSRHNACEIDASRGCRVRVTVAMCTINFDSTAILEDLSWKLQSLLSQVKLLSVTHILIYLQAGVNF